MLRKITLSLAFIAATFIANAQERESNTLTDKEIREMTWVEAMQDYRVNFNTVVDKFNKAHRGVPYEKGHGIKQFRRWEHMMGQRVDENGVRPHPGLLYQAIQGQNNQSTNEYGEWTAMGPYNAPSNGGIGRINNVAFHPKHNDTIYAGAPAGGLWVSYDDGQSWQTFTDELTNIGVSDLAIDPVHPDTMYLATGDRDAADTYSFGLLKSTDGGVTWSSTGLSYSVNQNYRIGRVVVHPDSTNIVIAATNGGVYRSTNYGTTFTLERTGAFYGIEMGRGDTVYATTSGSSPKIYRSADAGDNWTQLTNGLPTSGKYRCEVAVSGTPGKLYVVYGDSNYGYGGVYRSTNGGNSWSLMSSTPNIMGWANNGSGSGGQAWYDLTIACDPNAENTIYVGGVNIWKSTNGGSTWSIVGHWYGAGSTPYVHADHHHAIFRPNTSQLYVGTDGGVYKTSNGGSSWSDLNDGMNITQYYKISQSTSDSSLVLAGAQDNGSHMRSTTMNWSEVTGGDGMDNGVDAVNDNRMYTSVYYGSFYTSNNGGAFFSPINSLTPSGSGNWVTPFQVDPVTANTAYAGFKKIWKTTNAGSSWTATSTNNVNGNSNIDEFEVAPSNTNYIYVLINQGVYKSTNGGSTWSTITPSGSLSPGNNVLGIAIDPDDEDHIAIAISGFNSNKKAMESFNGGQSWTNISSGLPNVPATAVIFEGNNSDGIYIGTDIGVYYKSSNYPSWVSYNKNLPNVIINDFEMYADESMLRIGTYGRGVWQSPLMVGLSTVPEASFTADPVSTCSLGDTVQLTDNSSGQPTSWYWQITPSTYNFVGGTNDSSQFPLITFTATGNYTISLTATNTYGSDDTTQYQAISVGGATLPFVEDFENGPVGWEIINPDNGMTWSSATVGGTTPGSTAMTVGHYSYSTTGAVDELVSPPLDFSNDTLVSMTFEYASAYYSTSYSDSLKVYVSDDCGSSWAEVAAWSSADANFSTAGQLTSSFVPNDSTKWCHGNSSAACPSIDLDAYSGMSGIQVKFVAINGYGNNVFIDNINIIGQAQVAPVASFTGDSAACTGQTLNFFDFTTPTPAARTWYFQGGTPSTSNAPNPSVTYAAAGSYDVKLVVSNAAGVDSVTLSNYVTITPAPVSSVALSVSATTVCKHDSVFATATGTNGGLTPAYDWYVNGTVVLSGSTSYSGTFNDGDVLKVEMTSSDDCVSAKVVADSITINVNPLPAVTLSSQGYVCELDGPQQLSGGTPAGGIYSGTGVTNDSIFPSVAGVGSHWIYYTYADATTGCSNTKQRTMSVQPAPGKPTVSQDATTGELVAATPAGSYSYEWLDANMDPIAGATSATYMPTANGDYYVKIISNIQCSNVSDVYSVNNIGLDEELLEGFEIFPNPATNLLTIRTTGEAQLRVIDAAGRTVLVTNITGSLDLDVQGWARGAYMVQLIKGDIIETLPVMLK
ncbi:MAG: Xyloglucanase [Cryomorphaceae bacterium]|nr:MAG: Xyloglucanase [Cryomorphaceae bacterium]